MSDEEDDYMSDNFIVKAQEVKPDITMARNHRRRLKIETERDAREDYNRSVPKKSEVEKAHRDEALSKPVAESSKGFALMAKMGFKPGMSLGKKKDENDMGSGIKEPLPLELKANRTGLGHEKEENDKRKDRIKAEMDRMRDRASRHVELMDEYRKRKRESSSTKQLIGDIIRSRKVCLELDLRIELESPAEPWFWKSYRKPKPADEESETARQRLFEEEDDGEVYIYSNGQAAPKEERYEEFCDDALEERLEQITAYLRGTHFYCVWCGCGFSDEAELSSDCPGDSRQSHDNDDD